MRGAGTGLEGQPRETACILGGLLRLFVDPLRQVLVHIARETGRAELNPWVELTLAFEQGRGLLRGLLGEEETGGRARRWSECGVFYSS